MPKVEKNEINLKKCFCPNCPSYNECAQEKTEKLYCAKEIGKSTCAYKTNGCICSGCPVHMKNDLKAGYYCINGSADEVDDKKLM